jgi:hypothetical protein
MIHASSQEDIIPKAGRENVSTISSPASFPPMTAQPKVQINGWRSSVRLERLSDKPEAAGSNPAVSINGDDELWNRH